MHILSSVQTVISVHSNNIHSHWKLNYNLLEANVINIMLLLGGLIYVLQKFLGQTLYQRQEKVLVTLQEAEDQLEQAKNRLAEAEKQLRQSQIVIDQIEKEAINTARKVRQSILDQGKLDIQRLIEAGKLNIVSSENTIRKQIQEQITALAIKRVFAKLNKEMNSDRRTALINKSIAELGDTL